MDEWIQDTTGSSENIGNIGTDNQEMAQATDSACETDAVRTMADTGNVDRGNLAARSTVVYFVRAIGSGLINQLVIHKDSALALSGLMVGELFQIHKFWKTETVTDNPVMAVWSEIFPEPESGERKE